LAGLAGCSGVGRSHIEKSCASDFRRAQKTASERLTDGLIVARRIYTSASRRGALAVSPGPVRAATTSDDAVVRRPEEKHGERSRAIGVGPVGRAGPHRRPSAGDRKHAKICQLIYGVGARLMSLD
jgi:hypothetical protein